ncbi:hypothetical protein ACWKSP_34510 [Micromonosporaceae bacterium Da 78-11]
MPVIDLDAQVPTARLRRPRPRVLIVLVLGLVFFGLTGDPVRSTDATDVCGTGKGLDGAVIISPETGEVLQTLVCPA